MSNLKEILEKKTQLLCKGINLDEKFMESYKATGIEFQEGRKGGAGPLGGRYFVFDDDTTIVNTPLWHDNKNTSLKLRNEKNGVFEILDENENSVFAHLRLIPPPNYYNRNTSDGIQMKKVALIHGIDCLATTIYQKCHYWSCGTQCQFCGIEYSLNSGETIEQKSAQQIIEVIQAAKEENRCEHITLTTGTTSTPDKGVGKYLNIVKNVKNEYPDIPIHVQIEAVDNLNNIDLLKEAGADTIGIHIEILDEFIRKIVCPGKSDTSYEVYEKNWEYALHVFGRDQVSTFILVGFGESIEDLFEELEKVVEIGVIPYITPVRAIPQSPIKMPIMNYLMLLRIYSHAAKLMKKYNVNPLKNKAGCVKCGGCSAISEAFRLRVI